MHLQTPIDGIHIQHHFGALHVQSQALLTTLSSSFHGGGFRRVRHIFNANVPVDYHSDTPAAALKRIAAQCGVNAPFVGLLTAVPLRKARLVSAEEKGLRVGVLATAGTGNATSAGISPPHDATPGTINLIILIDAKLTRPAMLNAIITATEAKTATLSEMAILTPDGAPATGTSTDTVTIATTGLGPAYPYAGPATALGWLIGKTVRQAVQASLLAE
jgi:adenosylcobinamide hydrolase